MRVSVGHGHNFATYKGSCDLYLGLCLKTLAQVFTRPIFLMKVFDLLHDDGAISEGHFGLNRHWFVADEQLVIHFPVNDHAIDVAELARLDASPGSSSSSGSGTGRRRCLDLPRKPMTPLYPVERCRISGGAGNQQPQAGGPAPPAFTEPDPARVHQAADPT